MQLNSLVTLSMAALAGSAAAMPKHLAAGNQTQPTAASSTPRPGNTAGTNICTTLCSLQAQVCDVALPTREDYCQSQRGAAHMSAGRPIRRRSQRTPKLKHATLGMLHVCDNRENTAMLLHLLAAPLKGRFAPLPSPGLCRTVPAALKP
ncbi:hypothetical protein VTN02DRAFT_1581 [Thermoascus thermophilus]